MQERLHVAVQCIHSREALNALDAWYLNEVEGPVLGATTFCGYRPPDGIYDMTCRPGFMGRQGPSCGLPRRRLFLEAGEDGKRMVMEHGWGWRLGRGVLSPQEAAHGGRRGRNLEWKLGKTRTVI